jgi:long-chain acyl-CoA synthetase
MANLWMAIEAAARHSPVRVALQVNTSSITYQELREKVLLAGTNIRQAGVLPGQPVGLLFQNTSSCIIVFLALAMLRNPVVLFSDESTIADIGDLLEKMGGTALFGGRSALEQFHRSSFRRTISLIDVDVLLTTQSHESAGIEAHSLSDDQIFVYHYTSGSTGRPKAVMHSQQNLINGGEIYRSTYHIAMRDTLLVTVPLYHSFGLVAGLVTSLLVGARLILIERFVPNQVLAILEREHVTVLIGVPLVYDLLARCDSRSNHELTSLRIPLSSGSPLLLPVSERFMSRCGRQIYEVYGSTETGVIAAQWPIDTGWPVQSVGRSLPGVHVRIIDDSGNDVSPGSVGQLIVQTPSMFLGYFGEDLEHSQVFHEGWYRTGDLARQNSDGDLFLIGRDHTFIEIGEQKINPLEIERVLLSHPQVREALVYADEGLCAAVVGEGEISTESLLALCRSYLTPPKVPDTITLVSELPKGELNKLRRIVSGIRSL